MLPAHDYFAGWQGSNLRPHGRNQVLYLTELQRQCKVRENNIEFDDFVSNVGGFYIIYTCLKGFPLGYCKSTNYEIRNWFFCFKRLLLTSLIAFAIGCGYVSSKLKLLKPVLKKVLPNQFVYNTYLHIKRGFEKYYGA